MSLAINEVHQGDCLTIMKDIPDKSVDMVLCDLPYGTTQNKWDSIIPLELLWNEYERVIKDNGAIVLTSAQPFTSALVMSNPKLFKYSWTWIKSRGTNHLNARKQPLRATEDVCVFYKKQSTYNPQLRDKEIRNIRNTKSPKSSKGSSNYGKTRESFQYNEGREIPVEKGYPLNYFEFDVVGNNFDKGRLHPTQKPVELFEYLIRTYTNDGETVLDNCIGSGTTAVATSNVGGGRRFIGIEQDAGYVAIARQRISDAMKTEVDGGDSE